MASLNASLLVLALLAAGCGAGEETVETTTTVPTSDTGKTGTPVATKATEETPAPAAAAEEPLSPYEVLSPAAKARLASISLLEARQAAHEAFEGPTYWAVKAGEGAMAAPDPDYLSAATPVLRPCASPGFPGWRAFTYSELYSAVMADGLVEALPTALAWAWTETRYAGDPAAPSYWAIDAATKDWRRSWANGARSTGALYCRIDKASLDVSDLPAEAVAAWRAQKD